jgi:hypothetical protein
MSDPFENELKALFDVVESPEQYEAESSPDCEELKHIDIRYEKQEVVGQGGVKKVWAAHDNFSKRMVAYAQPRDGLHPLFYDLLLEEAWLTSSLQHPNIIKIHDVGIDDDRRPFFTMDFKRGKNLGGWRSIQEEVDLDQCLGIFLTICEAIEHAHSKGILHLDLKPENIQLESFSEVVVCDWGLARKIAEPLVSSTKEVADGAESADSTIGGTPGFMAPEQIKKDETPGVTADVYGLGALLYYMVTCQKCLEGDSAGELIRKTLSGGVVSLRERFPSLKISRTLDGIILKCLALKAEDRYLTVKDVVSDLRNFQKNQPTSFEKKNKLFCFYLFYKRQNVLCNLAIVIMITVSFGIRWFTLQIAEEVQQRLQAEVKMTAAEEGVEQMIKDLNDKIAIIKQRTIYTKTGEAVEIMYELSRLVQTLDPESHMADHQIAETHFIQLNTAKTKAMLSHYTPTYEGLLEVFKKAPEVHFTKERRPTTDELIDFLSKLNYNNLGRDLGSRIILYDYDLWPEKNRLQRYLAAIDVYLRQSGKNLNFFDYDLNLKTKNFMMHCQSSDSKTPAPDIFILSRLNIRTMVLKGNLRNGSIHNSGILTLPIQTLDLTGLKSMNFDILLQHPTLETLIIRQGAFKQRLKQLKAKFKVVER